MPLDLLAWIERLPPVTALKLSFYVYPLVSAAHILAIGVVVACVILMDLRILGIVRAPERAPLLALLREAIGIALPFAVLTGIALFSIRAQEYATNPAFQAKMALLCLGGLNAFAFHRLCGTPPGDVPYPASARLLAVSSLAIWVSILVAGRFIGFI